MKKNETGSLSNTQTKINSIQIEDLKYKIRNQRIPRGKLRW